jgi:predicted  nucleic acid-binding Zn-ribbon protein
MEFSLQALLVRHEAYMADAEQERLDMMGRIEELEGEKTGLQKTNETLVEDNRSLLDQLEALNNAVTESDTRVLSLQSTLQSAQQEMQRLSHLAAKTERLEQQLADFERDHETFQSTLETKEQAEKEATRRWKKAERALADMQSQLDRIEQEAREERERHVEVVGRMERRRAVEKELTSAAGRLKGAAASKTTGSGTSVVSHFVKDILQDNANLQMGIVELREMLQNSNGEVENLRQQLVLHQPLEEDEEEDVPRPPIGARQPSLHDEINRATSQELHVHHHYHAPSNSTAAANSRNNLRRPKKKRYGGLTPNQFTPPTSGRTTPRSSVSYRTPSSMATILQQTAVSVPDSAHHNHRWSVQSNQTYQSLYASSGPGSPQSTLHRTSSIFDRVFSDGGHESSRPTTPDTEPPSSPVLAPTHKSRPSVTGFRTASAPVVNRKGITPGPSLSSISSIPDMSIEDLPSYKPRPTNHHVITEETEDDWDETSSAVLESTSSGVTPVSEHRYFDIHSSDIYDRPLRRATSHESLLSISGMDIHTYQSRPKHSLLTQGGVTSGTIVSSAQAHAARPAATTRMETNGHSLLRGMAADQRLAAAPKQTITKKASGWIFGRWGATPGPLDGESSRRTKSASIKSGSDRAKDDSLVQPKFPKLRNPGINQSGPILGFGPEIKIHHPPVVKKLDQEELRNVLDEA